MQKWEYLWTVIPRNTGEKKTSDGSKMKALDYLDHLGRQGWELVSTEQVNPGGWTDYYFFFKRPLEEDTETTTAEALRRAGPPPSG